MKKLPKQHLVRRLLTYAQMTGLEVVQEGRASQKFHRVVVVLVPRRVIDVDFVCSRRSKVVHDGVQKVVVRVVSKIKFDHDHGEDCRVSCLPVAQEGAIAKPDEELLDACVLESQEGLLKVPVDNRGRVVRGVSILLDANFDAVFRIVIEILIRYL